MAFVLPFTGIRYNTRKVRSLGRVISPPYDVISPAQRARLSRAHPANIVRLELPEPAGRLDRYQHAARLYGELREEGLFARDAARQYYLYEQVFTVDGRRYRRRGFFGAVRLERPGTGVVLPHERTFSGPKEDRLRLMKALRMNISPIFLLFPDAGSGIVPLLERCARQKPAASCTTPDGISHRMWCMNDAHSQNVIHYALLQKKLLIADGHHRYETAWVYSQLVRSRGKKREAMNPDYVLSFLCPMEDAGLVILPTHRLVRCAGAAGRARLEQSLGRYCARRTFSSLRALRQQMARAVGKRPVFGLVTRRGYALLELTVDLDALGFMSSHSPAFRRLEVTILHHLLLKEEAVGISYIKDAAELSREARHTDRTCGFLMNATPMDAVGTLAEAGETMPEKSTYFYPKLATGMVLKSLEGEV